MLPTLKANNLYILLFIGRQSPTKNNTHIQLHLCDAITEQLTFKARIFV